MLIIEVLNYTIIQNFAFSRAFISQIGLCAAIIIHDPRLFLFILQEVHCLQIFDITMHYPQWYYITVSELHLLKRKKKWKIKNLQN